MSSGNRPHGSVTWPQHACWKLMIAESHFAAPLPGPIWACCRPVTPLWFTGYLNRTLMLLATPTYNQPPPPHPFPTASFPPPILRHGIAAMPLKVVHVRLTCRNDQESDFRCHVFIVWKKRHSLHLLWCGHKAKRTQEVVAVEAREAGKCTTVRHGSELCTVSAVRCFISVRSEQSFFFFFKKRKKLKLIKMNHHTFFLFFCSYFTIKCKCQMKWCKKICGKKNRSENKYKHASKRVKKTNSIGFIYLNKMKKSHKNSFLVFAIKWISKKKRIFDIVDMLTISRPEVIKRVSWVKCKLGVDSQLRKRCISILKYMVFFSSFHK